jgi:tetratricopeptide (TPR) repeat protein
MNLGVTQESMGNRARALDYHQQSIAVYERLGDQQRAAEHLANVGSLLIEYAGRAEEGLRDVQTALAVFRDRKNKDFEAYCLRVLSWYHRNAGRYGESERLLNEALSIVRVNGFLNEVPPITVDLARSRLVSGDYIGARDLLAGILGTGSQDEAEARIVLAASHVRLGNLDAADQQLQRARQDVETRRRALGPVFALVRGEVAMTSGRLDDARARFAEASRLWADAFPDPAAVEALAYVGLLDTRGLVQAVATLESAHEQAQVIGSSALVSRVRILMARRLIESGDGPRGLRTLVDLRPDDAMGRELRAEAHFWRGRAYALLGDVTAAQRERELARQVMEQLRTSLPIEDQQRFASRPTVRPILDPQKRSD